VFGQLDSALTASLIEAGEVVIAFFVLFSIIWVIMRPLIGIISASAKDAESKREELITLRQQTNEQLQLNRMQVESMIKQIEANNEKLDASRIAEQQTQHVLMDVRSDLSSAIELVKKDISAMSESMVQDIIASFPIAVDPIMQKLEVLDRIEKKAERLADDTAVVKAAVMDMKKTLIDALVKAVLLTNKNDEKTDLPIETAEQKTA
jgi:hypothetical protein